MWGIHYDGPYHSHAKFSILLTTVEESVTMFSLVTLVPDKSQRIVQLKIRPSRDLIVELERKGQRINGEIYNSR